MFMMTVTMMRELGRQSEEEENEEWYGSWEEIVGVLQDKL
jgi:hypothetical protein